MYDNKRPQIRLLTLDNENYRCHNRVKLHSVGMQLNNIECMVGSPGFNIFLLITESGEAEMILLCTSQLIENPKCLSHRLVLVLTNSKCQHLSILTEKKGAILGG